MPKYVSHYCFHDSIDTVMQVYMLIQMNIHVSYSHVLLPVHIHIKMNTKKKHNFKNMLKNSEN